MYGGTRCVDSRQWNEILQTSTNRAPERAVNREIYIEKIVIRKGEVLRGWRRSDQPQTI